MTTKNAYAVFAAAAFTLLLAPGCATVQFSALSQSEQVERGSASQVALRSATSDLVALTEERDWTEGESQAVMARRALTMLLNGANGEPPAQRNDRASSYLQEISASEASTAAAFSQDISLLYAHVERVNVAANSVIADSELDESLIGADLRSCEAAIRRSRSAYRLFTAALRSADGVSASERESLRSDLDRLEREIDVMSVRADDIGAMRTRPIFRSVG